MSKISLEENNNYKIATEFYDVLFKFKSDQTKMVKGNRGILTIRSEYFRMMLSRNKQKKEIVLDFDPEIFEIIIKYLYDDRMFYWKCYNDLEDYNYLNDEKMFLLITTLHEMMFTDIMLLFINIFKKNTNNLELYLKLKLYDNDIENTDMYKEKIYSLLKDKSIDDINLDIINNLYDLIGLKLIEFFGSKLFEKIPNILNLLDNHSIKIHFNILNEVYSFQDIFDRVISLNDPNVKLIDGLYVLVYPVYNVNGLVLSIPIKVGMNLKYLHIDGKFYDCIIKSLRLPNINTQFNESFNNITNFNINDNIIITLPTNKYNFYYIPQNVKLHELNQ